MPYYSFSDNSFSSQSVTSFSFFFLSHKKNTDKLNLSGQIVRLLITCCFSFDYKAAGQPSGQIQFVRVLKITPFISLV